VLGKTNLDQFATGLVGTRSPYGVPHNPFDPRFIPGGSSSGSAVAVARGMATFALGTDTAGSGRVPAAFNGLVGLKPSLGILGTTGVVPACRSLDCVSVFAHTCADAWRIFEIARHFDASDPYARRWDDLATPGPLPATFRFGVPEASQLEFFGDGHTEHAFAEAVGALRALGGQPTRVDFSAFRQVAQLLYDGPWVAERLEASGALLAANPAAFDPCVREILLRARGVTADAVFRGQARLAALARATAEIWQGIDVLVTPTTPTIYTVAQVASDPIALNTRLGYYTNYVNLLDLCALAVPAGFRPDGLPVGITLVAPRGHDQRLLDLGARFHGETAGQPAPGAGSPPLPDADQGACLAVVGAHLAGEPLNHQLTGLHARLVKRTRTAPRYRLFALPNTTPAKPGLVRSANGGGFAVTVEVWWLSFAALGRFVAAVPAPLCIGSIELEDGSRVQGFLCEEHALRGAPDISRFGGWQAFLKTKEDRG